MSSFADFYGAEYAGAVRLAHLLSGSRDACEDIVQDAFTRLQPRFGELAAPAAYLRVTVVNLCRSRHRRQIRMHRRAHLVPVADAAVLGGA